MGDRSTALRIHVHDDSRILDAMQQLVDLGRSNEPLSRVLDEMCALIAMMATVDIASIYVREDRGSEPVLVMRGNVGFPRDAVGRVQLGLYEGLTGVVAQRRRPVSVAMAQADSRYKHVDGIGEEHYAAYLGIPLVVGGDVAGVLVMQRRAAGTFTDADVSFASSLTAPLILAIERGGERERTAGARFIGIPLVCGQAIGPACLVPPPTPGPRTAAHIRDALDHDLATLARSLRPTTPAIARALENLHSVARALRDDAAVQYVPYHASPGTKDLAAIAAERQREVDDLWHFLASDATHQLAICGAVLVLPRLGALVALEVVARGASAVLVTGASEGAAREILDAAQIPAITGLAVLRECVRASAIVEVDADRGRVHVR